MATESRKLWWIIIALLIGMSALAATNIYILMQNRGDTEPTDSVSQDSEGEPVDDTSLFVDIKPFTVNLQSDSYGNRLLYTGVTLQVGSEETRDYFEERMPQVRSRLLSLFSGRQASELITPRGKEQLTEDVLANLRQPLSPGQPELVVHDVLFTEFIVQ